ncbi:MAG: hypothetical protein KTR33_16540 [Gammaproteobacteria bacterium]|nr:hypothetical protein [Gammaproteobacteria bacterium]
MVTVGSRHPLKLELFPFISLFLCVIGVLAFLQNLFVLGDIGESEEEASQPQIFHTPFRIDCYPDRIVLHPPSVALDGLINRLTLDEQTALGQILLRREVESDAGGVELGFSAELDVDTLERLLNEIVTINQLSANERYPYEEYLLFDVHSGGSDIFHYLRLVLDAPEYRHLRAGLEIAGSKLPAEIQ